MQQFVELLGRGQLEVTGLIEHQQVQEAQRIVIAERPAILRPRAQRRAGSQETGTPVQVTLRILE